MNKPTYSREELEKIIEGGGAVLHRGELITHKDNLPSNKDIQAAHEGRERVEYPRGGTAEAAVANQAGDPTVDDRDPVLPPEGTDAAARAAATGKAPSNTAAKETRPV